MTSTWSEREVRAVGRLIDFVGPCRLRYCPLEPTARQEAFLRLRDRESLYGGAAGGGKSVALLMAALGYCDVPGYDALLLRPSRSEFELPGGLMDLALDWLAGGDAVWSGENHTWRFPGPGKSGAGGASLHFGYLEGSKDIPRYSGTSFSFIGFDELTRFSEQEYRRMFRVLRQPQSAVALQPAPDGTSLADVPLRVRSTSNPGGINHEWVKSYFVDPKTRSDGVVFLPARLEHNPHIDREEYALSLAELPPSERERLLHGDWEIADEGELFQRHWFEVIDRRDLPKTDVAIRYWDLAATPPGPGARDPDYTVGSRLELDFTSGTYYITDVVRVRLAAGAVEQLVAAIAEQDGPTVEIGIEQERGASGKTLMHLYKSQVLRGFSVRSDNPTGEKTVRARPIAAAAENGLVKIVRTHNTTEVLDEICAFPNSRHDDCVDALTGAHKLLPRQRRLGLRSIVPQGNLSELAVKYRAAEGGRLTAYERRRRYELEQEETRRLAGELGLPYYDSQTTTF